MRIAFITDSHFDLRSRFEECIRVHDFIADDAARRGCTLTLLGGDLHERKSVAEERNAVAAWLVRMAKLGPVIGVYGNHSTPNDLDLYERLETRHPIRFRAQPVVHSNAGVAVACLPWPRRAQLAASLGDAASSEELDQTGHDMLCAVLRGLGDLLAEHDGPRIALAHVQTDGCKTSTGQELIGGEISVGLVDLALARAAFYALGHIHLGPGNEWEVNGAPVVYGGSPRRCSYGEDEVKSYTVIEFDGPRLVGWERVSTPCTPMLLLEADWRDGALEGLDATEIPASAEVRLRFRCPADGREAARADARRWAAEFEQAGAASVKLEEQLTVETRARAPEVARARALPDKLEALWVAKKYDPGERREPLLAKLDELETAIPVGVISQAQGACLESIRLRGFGPFVDHEVSLDLTALPGQLIAIHGPNGGGKSTVLGAFAAAMFREHPAYGKLHKLARTRDAFLEVGLVTDARYRIRQTMDDVSRKGESLVLGEDKKPQFATTKTSAFDEWAAKHLPTKKVFYSAPYLRQKDGGFAELEKGDRIAAVLRVLGTERLETLAKAARDRAAAAKNKVTTLETRIADELARAGGVAQIEAELEAARGRVDEAETALADARAKLDDAKALAQAAEEAERQTREVRAQRRKLADAIREEQSKLSGLDQKIRNNRRVLDERDEIDAAVARARELDGEIRELRDRLAEAEQAEREAREAVARHQDALHVTRGNLGAAEGRLARAQERTKNREAVEAAVAEVPRRQEAFEAAERAAEQAHDALAAVQGQQLAGAEDRIEDLRGGLQLIADGDPKPQAVAITALGNDADAVHAAAAHPQRLAAARKTEREGLKAVSTARKALEEAERLAARADDIQTAASEAAEIRREIDDLRSQIRETEKALTEARRELPFIEQKTLAAREQVAAARDERAGLDPMLVKAEPLAKAEARLEELNPQAAASRDELKRLEAELVASPEPPIPPSAPALAPLDSRVMDLEQAARNAHSAVAVTEQRLEDAKTAGERIATLREEQATMQDDLADWTRLADDLGRGGIQAMEVDAAGCELTETSNLLLHSCHGPRWSVRVDTQRLDAKGKRLIEDCKITVLDTESGREAPIEGFSGGEQVILGEALSLAMTALACRVNGIEGSVLVRDESGAALDADNVPVYIRMLRKAAEQIGASRVLFVAHNPEAWALADARVEVRDGQITVAA